jgi:hypothetical protein
VAIGIAAGDGLLAVVGTGPWQTGLIAALAVIVAVAFIGRGVLLTLPRATPMINSMVRRGRRPAAAATVPTAAIGANTGFSLTPLFSATARAMPAAMPDCTATIR